MSTCGSPAVTELGNHTNDSYSFWNACSMPGASCTLGSLASAAPTKWSAIVARRKIQAWRGRLAQSPLTTVVAVLGWVHSRFV